MKKRILSTLLLLCTLVTMLPITVLATEAVSHDIVLSDMNAQDNESVRSDLVDDKNDDTETHTHPICGSTCTDGEHTEDITWQPIYTAADLFKAQDGYYYLANDVEFKRYDPEVKSGVVLCLNGHSIRQTWDNRSVIKVMSGITFTLTDCKGGGTNYGQITRPSGNKGYGVYVKGGTFHMYGGNITGNGNTGVYVESSGTFNLYDGMISENQWDNAFGGGVYVGSSCTFNMYGGSITGNKSRGGGGVYIAYSGAFNLSGGSITGNTASTPSYTAQGGGVFANGGAISVSGNPVVKDNTVSNSASNIYLTSNVTMSVMDMTSGAEAGITTEKSNYPVVFSNACDTDYSSYFFADDPNAHVEYNSDKQLQLAAGAPHEHVWAEAWSSSATYHWHACTVSDCGATNEKAEHTWGDDGRCTECGCAKEHTHCICGGDVTAGDHNSHTEQTFLPWSGGDAGYKNGVAYVYLEQNITLNSNLEVTGGNTLYLCLHSNTISSNGTNKIVVKEGSRLVICDCSGGGVIKGATKGWGGTGIYVYQSTLDIFGGKITGGKVTSSGGGGAIALDDKNCVLNIYGGELSGNNGNQSGGAIFLNNNNDSNEAGGGTVNLYGGKICNNTATNGGAIYAVSGGTINLIGGEISGNTSKNDGGAVYGKNGVNIKITGTKLTENKGRYGGAICLVDGCTLIMEKGEISKNQATEGGAVSVFGKNSTFTLVNGSITDNSATDGGAVYLNQDNSLLNMGGGTISGNTATGHGGAVYTYRDISVMTMSGGTIENNTAGEAGGAIYINKGQLNLMDAPVIRSNTVSGKANNVYLKNGKMLTVYNFESTEKIGVTTEILPTEGNPVVFCNDSDQDYSAYFFADDDNAHVEYNSNKQLQLADGAPSTHTHVWSTEWDSNNTHHWHNCTAEGCDITDNAQKDGYAEHSGEDDGNCTTAVDCETCNYQIKNAESAHNYPDEWTPVRPGSTHTRKCRNEGCSIAITNSCVSDGKATCQEFAKCTICGGDCGTKADHDFTAETVGEDYLKSAATCTAKAVYYKSCSVCGLSSQGTADEDTFESGELDANNHTGDLSDWQYNANGHWQEYLCCHAQPNAGPHTYDNETDTTCNICGYTRTITPSHTHSWSTEWTSDSTHHWHECTAEGCDVTENPGKDGYGAHVYDSIADTTCNTCGYQRGKVEVKFNSITAVGNGNGNWLHDANWAVDDSSNHMTQTAPNVYEITYTGIAAFDDYQVKFAANDSWTDNWGAGDDAGLTGAAVYNSQSNIKFSVDTNDSTVKLVLDLSNYDPDTKQGATYSVTITPPHTHPICGTTCSDGEHTDNTWQAISTAEELSNATNGYYYLVNDVTLENQYMKDGVILCLNGHSIKSHKDMPVIDVLFGRTFTLTDCTGEGTITHDSGNSGYGVRVFGGTFDMYGGSITGNGSGGVYVQRYEYAQSDSTFNMYGGSITGNKQAGGGGVDVNGGTFNLRGGSITGNTGTSFGGGVYVASGTVNISGNPVIEGNTVSGKADNLYLFDHITISVSEMTSGAKIGITTKDINYPVVFSSVCDTDYSEYFFADDANAHVEYNSDKKLQLAHTHAWATAWTYDETHHWHECANSGCDVTENSGKDGYGAHVYDNDAYATCDICGYVHTVAHTITFDANGGTVIGSTTAQTNADGKLSSLPTATHFGSYFFDGWYTQRKGGTKITTDTVFTEDTTVYAHWTYINFNIGGSDSRYDYCTIRATAGDNGSLSPVGNVSVREGKDQIFTITPDTGYVVSDVLVDGRSIGAVTSYTFTNVRSDHTIEALFEKEESDMPQTLPFVDVAADAYYYDAVLWAVENGITSGTDDVHFTPDVPCTRAQIVTFLWRAAGEPVVNYAMQMDDVAEDAYYAEAVRWALSCGITTGATETTFRPDDECTRAQAVVFLFRYAAIHGMDAVTLQELVSGYADADSVPDYALPAMNWALAAGIVQGDGTYLMPNDSCTRGQIVTFLWRTLVK